MSDVSWNKWNSKIVNNYTINELVINIQLEFNGCKVKVVSFNEKGESKERPKEYFGFFFVNGKNKERLTLFMENLK